MDQSFGTFVELSHEIAHLHQCLAQKDHTISALCFEVTSHLAAYTQLRIDYETLYQNNRDYHIEIFHLKKQLQEAETRNQQQITKIKTLLCIKSEDNATNKELRELYAQLQEKYEELKEEYHEMQSRLEDAEESLQAITGEAEVVTFPGEPSGSQP